MPPTGPAPGPLLGGADRAVLVASLGHRLRSRGVRVTLTSMRAFADALAAAPPARLTSLYWLARLTLVDREHDVAVFDQVFRAAFEDAVLEVDPHARRTGTEQEPGADDVLRPVAGAAAGSSEAADLPWHTLPQAVATLEHAEGEALPELLPSAVARLADTPFDELDEEELALMGRWLEESAYRWPTRRSRRRRIGPTGRRVALRETIAAARRTGWEPMELKHHTPVRRPLTLTLVCDVSQSMQPYSTAYLHVMRALARTGRAEVFAFSTSLTRLTPALSHRSAREAIRMAGEQVVDRYGGTHLAGCLRELLVSRHGHAVRGGVLVIASDGWDSDDPAELAAVMARARRRARRIVWLNPRAAAPGFEPLVGSMAAALPFCDDFLPAHTLRELPDVFEAVAGPRTSSRA